MNFKVEWDKRKNQFFLSGSIVQFDDQSRSVYFKNEFFSPGSIVVSWSSKVEHNKTRGFMELPLLKREKAYNLSSQLIARPEDSLRIKINYYNREEKLLDSSLLNLPGGEFTYPSEAFYYTIELINLGIRELLFDNLRIE